ncbi:MAG: TIGR01244 family sulfur transferase [Sphingomonas sp.]
MIHKLDETFAVSPQITPADVTELARAGFLGVINNRPDGEEPGQPASAAIRAVCETLGMAYTEIPVTHAGFSHPQLDAMAAALDAAGGPVLAFCRSGTRSCNLWALAMAKQGAAPDDLCGKAAASGYDLGGIRPMLDALSGGA